MGATGEIKIGYRAERKPATMERRHREGRLQGNKATGESGNRGKK
jgi:hypothetical protein